VFTKTGCEQTAISAISYAKQFTQAYSGLINDSTLAA